MKHLHQLATVSMFCLTMIEPLAAEQYSRLQYDPFNRPDFETLPKPIEAKIEKPKQPEVWDARLFATMRSGQHSLANVNGNIIAIGESIDGYRLIEVHERIAVFMNDGKRYELDLDGTNKENDERNLSANK